MLTMLSTTRSSSSPSRGLNAGGGSCAGSSSTILSAYSKGSRSRMSLTRSPFGSTTTRPRPALMVARLTCSSCVVLPDPVEPSMWVWYRKSGTGRATACPPTRARPRVMVPRPPVGTWIGAGTDLARARVRPGTARSVGSPAMAASSGVDNTNPCRSRRAASTPTGWRSRTRRSRFAAV